VIALQVSRWRACFGGCLTSTSDINDAGTVVGSAENQVTNGANLCIWRRGVRSVDLRATNGSWLTRVSRITNRGWVLGSLVVLLVPPPAGTPNS
jgi:hypothetical protein